jgi:alkaline phosphatase D
MPQAPGCRSSPALGALTSFFVLDERQYRTNQPCGDGTRAICDAARDPRATLLGPDQEQWLFEGLDRSRSRWNILPQQVMLAKVDQAPGPDVRHSMDQWPGYEAGRARLMDFLHARRPANPVVLTGDIHSNWVNDLKLDDADERSAVVGTEFVVDLLSRRWRTLSVRAKSFCREPFVKFRNTQRGLSHASDAKAMRGPIRCQLRHEAGRALLPRPFRRRGGWPARRA